jgi:hypothetical protein
LATHKLFPAKANSGAADGSLRAMPLLHVFIASVSERLPDHFSTDFQYFGKSKEFLRIFQGRQQIVKPTLLTSLD